MRYIKKFNESTDVDFDTLSDGDLNNNVIIKDIPLKGLYVTPILLDKNYNYFFDMWPKDIQELIIKTGDFINDKYKDVIITKMGHKVVPGLITKFDADIKVIADELYQIFTENGLDCRVVYGEGNVGIINNNDIHRTWGELLIKIGRYMDTLKNKTGVYEATELITKKVKH